MRGPSIADCVNFVMSDKGKKKNVPKMALWGSLGVLFAATVAFCVYICAVAIPEKREAERRELEELRKKWEEGNAGITPAEGPQETAPATAPPEPSLGPADATPAPGIGQGPAVLPDADTTPTAEPAMEPTEIPGTTPSLTPTSTPVPSQAPTPEPTNTPVPILTMAITPTPMGEATIKIGEYEIPATYTYNGKEYLWFDEGKNTLIRAEKVGSSTYLVAYSDKNMDDKIKIFDTVTEERCVYSISNFDLKAATIPDMLGYIIEKSSKLPTSAEDPFRGMEIMSSLMPTPTPTPTPYPTPNPEQPKMLASFDCSEPGSSVTQEMWDNGYVYIKGTGATRWIGTLGGKAEDKPALTALGALNKWGFKAVRIIVEEGITVLGDEPCCSWSKTITAIELPSTLESIKTSAFNCENLMENDVAVTGYKNGEKTTFVVPAYTRLGDAIVENLDVKSKLK